MLLVIIHFVVEAHPNIDPALSFYAYTYIQDVKESINIDVVSLDISGEEKYVFSIKASELIWERKIGEVPVQFFSSPYLVYWLPRVDSVTRSLLLARHTDPYSKFVVSSCII